MAYDIQPNAIFVKEISEIAKDQSIKSICVSTQEMVPFLAQFVKFRPSKSHESFYLVWRSLEVFNGESIHGYTVNVEIQADFK